MTTKSDAQCETQPTLDPAKLLGFRNLALVTRPDGDLKEGYELAFNKKGIEAGS